MFFKKRGRLANKKMRDNNPTIKCSICGKILENQIEKIGEICNECLIKED